MKKLKPSRPFDPFYKKGDGGGGKRSGPKEVTAGGGPLANRVKNFGPSWLTARRAWDSNAYSPTPGGYCRCTATRGSSFDGCMVRRPSPGGFRWWGPPSAICPYPGEVHPGKLGRPTARQVIKRSTRGGGEARGWVYVGGDPLVSRLHACPAAE